MTPFFRGGLGICALTAIIADGAMPWSQADGRTVDLPRQVFGTSPAVFASSSPRADRWILQPDAQLAAVTAGSETGIFLGVQCDPFEPIAHRLILGVRKGSNAPEMRTLLLGGTRKIMITAEAPAITSAFEAAPEDRGQTDFAGSADYIAAQLSPAQFAAISSAKALFVQVGKKTYKFTGYGSNSALTSMTCRSRPVRVASRLIDRQRPKPTTAQKQAWRVNYHSGSAALIRGRMDASVSTFAKYADTGTSFKLGVACLGNKLYARIEADFLSSVQDDDGVEKTAKYIARFGKTPKQVEVYKLGQRLTTIVISKAEMAGLGHQLAPLDLANLMEADTLVVASGSNTLEFPATGSSSALNRIFQSCGVSS